MSPLLRVEMEGKQRENWPGYGRVEDRRTAESHNPKEQKHIPPPSLQLRPDVCFARP